MPNLERLVARRDVHGRGDRRDRARTGRPGQSLLAPGRRTRTWSAARAAEMLAATRAHLDSPTAAARRAEARRRAQTAEHTALQIVTDDMPFLVDSVTAAITARRARPHLLVHPQVVVRRETARPR